MSNALRQLLNNLSSVILALLLAVTVWIAATLQADPFGESVFPSVPVTAVNQPEGTILFEGDDGRVSVNARAPQSVLTGLGIDDFEAILDLSDIELGKAASVPISVTCSSEAVRIQDYNPLQQVVRLEALTMLTLPVDIQVVGQVATGYQATRPVIRPNRVVIYGPTPYLTEVVSVTGSLSVEGAKEGIVEQVSITPHNAEGRLATGLQWTPDQVEVRIGVRRRVGYKPDVEVVPDLRGEPAEGYRRGSVSVDPSTVTLAGPSTVLNDLPGFVKTRPITITGATAVLTATTPLTVPANVVVIGVNYVTVTVDILPILSSRTMTGTVEIQGLRQGLVATLSPSVVDVILEGPDSQLSEIGPDDIQVFVNLAGLGVGVHRLEPVVLAPQGIVVVSVIPETIEVAINLPPTPPPTSTLTIGEESP